LAPRALPSVKLNGVAAIVTHAPTKVGLTGVLILPGQHLEAVCAAVQALVESLPPQERVGVWYVASTGDAATLVVDFTNRRVAAACVPGAHRAAADATLCDALSSVNSKQHVITRLEGLRNLLAQSTVTTSDEAAAVGADKVLRLLARTDRFGEGPVSRNLVLAGETHFQLAAVPTGVIDAAPNAVSGVLWLAALSGMRSFDPVNGAVGWAGLSDDRGAVLGAGRTLAAVIAARRAATFRAAACLPIAPSRLLQVVVKSATPLAGATCRVSSPDFEAVQHELVSCDAADAAADAYPYGAHTSSMRVPGHVSACARARGAHTHRC
jgi:hypothetical protein